MAVVNKPLEQKQQANPYAGMVGVSSNTAQNLGSAQQKYQASDAVNQAQQTWRQMQQQKPGAFKSRYTDILNGVLNQIQNPPEFKYEFNGDGLFRSYADEYTQRGKQASLDAMGQAAGLTGGYGNSYAQQAGQQAYQNWLLGLYDKGMDLRDRAYGQFQDQRNDLKDQYNIFSSAENTDYGRYRDAVGDWTTQEQNAYNRYLNERDYDYNNYMNDLNYWTGLAEIENRAYTTEQQRLEDIRRYNQEWEHMLAQEAAAAEAGGPGGTRGPRSENPENQETVNDDISFKTANDILLNAKLNSPDLPASTIKSGLKGTVADYINNANKALKDASSSLYGKITGDPTVKTPNIASQIAVPKIPKYEKKNK